MIVRVKPINTEPAVDLCRVWGYPGTKSHTILARAGTSVAANRQFSIMLPADLADIVESKVESGNYASAGDVLRAGVRALLDREMAIEDWLRDAVVPGHQEYLDDPSRAVPASEILTRIKTRRSAAER